LSRRMSCTVTLPMWWAFQLLTLLCLYRLIGGSCAVVGDASCGDAVVVVLLG
jgi:hypothetical protein